MTTAQSPVVARVHGRANRCCREKKRKSRDEPCPADHLTPVQRDLIVQIDNRANFPRRNRTLNVLLPAMEIKYFLFLKENPTSFPHLHVNSAAFSSFPSAVGEQLGW